MIERALAQYLLSKPDVTTWTSRQVFRGRRPQAGKQLFRGRFTDADMLAVTINRTATNRIYHLQGEADVAEPTLTTTVWGRGNNAEVDVQQAFDEIRRTVSGFLGTWDGEEVLGCTLESENETPTPPTDGSGYWIYAYACTLRIHHRSIGTTLSETPSALVNRILVLNTGRVLKLSTGNLLVFARKGT